jgi:protein SCO1
MKLKGKFFWLLLLVPLVFLILFVINVNEQKPLRTLPYFGKKRNQAAGDTKYHRVKNFSFTDQYNETVTQQTVNGKIYITDFFFTTCQSICPVMSTQLERVYKEFRDNKDVMILSHTVNPEEDSVEVLMKYADLHKVNDKRWLFLTGDKKQLYEMARQSYLLNAEEGNGGAEDFIHTQNFALVDKEKHLRGFYDGTDSMEVARLIQDVHLLLQEYRYSEKKSKLF